MPRGARSIRAVLRGGFRQGGGVAEKAKKAKKRGGFNRKKFYELLTPKEKFEHALTFSDAEQLEAGRASLANSRENITVSSEIEHGPIKVRVSDAGVENKCTISLKNEMSDKDFVRETQLPNTFVSSEELLNIPLTEAQPLDTSKLPGVKSALTYELKKKQVMSPVTDALKQQEDLEKSKALYLKLLEANNKFVEFMEGFDVEKFDLVPLYHAKGQLNLNSLGVRAKPYLVVGYMLKYGKKLFVPGLITSIGEIMSPRTECKSNLMYATEYMDAESEPFMAELSRQLSLAPDTAEASSSTQKQTRTPHWEREKMRECAKVYAMLIREVTTAAEAGIFRLLFGDGNDFLMIFLDPKMSKEQVSLDGSGTLKILSGAKHIWFNTADDFFPDSLRRFNTPSEDLNEQLKDFIESLGPS